MLYIKTPLYARISIPEDRLTIFTNYPSAAKDQALEETVSPYPILWFTAALNSLVLLLRIQSPITMSPKANSQK